jgi:hypothetical protein
MNNFLAQDIRNAAHDRNWEALEQTLTRIPKAMSGQELFEKFRTVARKMGHSIGAGGAATGQGSGKTWFDLSESERQVWEGTAKGVERQEG